VKKIILWGDGILSGPSGFGELLLNHIFLHHPRADVAVSTYGGEHAGLQDALRETPFHVIGKAPDLVVLGFGYADLAAGKEPEEIARLLGSAVSLVEQKTSARICLLSLVSSFFSEEEDRAKCHAVNLLLRSLPTARALVLDLETPVEAFLAEHKRSPGEKRALHLDNSRLTLLGRLFLAHHCYALIPWPELDAAPAQALHV
jgi:hypothetical protein